MLKTAAAAIVLCVACALGPSGALGQSGTNVDTLIASCPPAADVAAINAGLSLSFESDPTGGTLVCTAATGSANLTRAQERAYQALRVMRQLQFTRSLPWTSLQLYAWLKQQIVGIRFRGDISLSFCCSPARVINIQLQNLVALSTTRWIDPQIGSGLNSLVAVITHEARHSEGPGHTCAGGNDATYRELGAWGIQRDLYLWEALYSTSFLDIAGPEVGYGRAQSLGSADQAVGRFCTAPSSDLSVTVADSPDPVEQGSQLTYTITVANAGPAAAENVALGAEIPHLNPSGGATAVAATAAAGTCTLPTGETGAVGCSLGTLAAGASTTVNVTFQVGATALGLLSNRLNTFGLGTSVTSTSNDPVRANNSATVTTLVTLPNVALGVRVTGRGVVRSSPAGIVCPKLCSRAFTANSTVRLTARAAKGYRFAAWSGACKGTKGCTVMLDSPKSVRAAFRKRR